MSWRVSSKYNTVSSTVPFQCPVIDRQAVRILFVVSDGQRIGCQPEKLLFTVVSVSVANSKKYFMAKPASCGLLNRVHNNNNRK